MKKIILVFVLCIICILLIDVSVIFINNKIQDCKLDKEVFTLEEAATYMKIPKKELIFLIKFNKEDIPYVKIRNKSVDYYIFSKKAIDMWLLKQQLEFKHPIY